MIQSRAKQTTPRFVFFGTSDFSVRILESLKQNAFFPSIIITAPDSPKGRGLKLTPSPVKIWAIDHHTPHLDPTTQNDEALLQTLASGGYEFYIVASYGKIIPKEILDIPPKGSLNVHPSLLPKLRGASPIETAILEENETGVTIMLMDEKMDHGPVLTQEKADIPEFPIRSSELERILADMGGVLLVETIKRWLRGEITPKEQLHENATFTRKLDKKDTLIDLNDNPEKNYRKILAYERYNPYFFEQIDFLGKEIRVLIKKARQEKGELIIEKVLPEGRKEMTWEEFGKWKNRDERDPE